MKEQTLLFFVSCSILVGCSFAQQTSFQANVKIYNDPNVSGELNGFMYYDGSNMKMRTDYSIGPKEIILFSSKTRYLTCGGDCESTYDVDAWPVFYKVNTDTSGSTVTINGLSCTRFNRATATTGEVQTLWIASSGTGQVCRAQLREASGSAGTTIDFTNNTLLSSTSVFDAYSTWNCPSKICLQSYDMFLVFDESGSIPNSSFVNEADFAVSLAGSFSFGSGQGVGMGLVMFADAGRVVTSLDYNLQSFTNAVNGVGQQGGNTCVGCGISLAQYQLDYADRSGVQDVMVVLLAGASNIGDYATAASNAKSQGTQVLVVGVGNVSLTQINQIASSPSYVFYSPSFNTSDLNSVLNQIINVLCLPLAGNACGSGCKGFCSCNQTCVCPECNDGNLCTDDVCNISSNGAGCHYPTKTCDDGNACTVNQCSANTGCDFSVPVNCNDFNSCTNDTCDPNAGCQFVLISCEDNSPCTSNVCSPSMGCTSTAVACDKCKFGPTGVEGPVICGNISCLINVCDPATGMCTASSKNCNDNNLCTTDNCVNDSCVYTYADCDDNDACTIDTCSPTAGCNHTAIDPAVACNDLNVCTTDTCNSTIGCVNQVQSCLSDNDICTSDVCNSILGCAYIPRDCASESNIAPNLGDCYEAKCSSSAGCYLQPAQAACPSLSPSPVPSASPTSSPTMTSPSPSPDLDTSASPSTDGSASTPSVAPSASSDADSNLSNGSVVKPALSCIVCLLCFAVITF